MQNNFKDWQFFAQQLDCFADIEKKNVGHNEAKSIKFLL